VKVCRKSLIAFGWLSPTAKKDCFEKYGVNVIYSKKGTLYEKKDVFGVSNYLLSHTAIKHNKHSLRWWGDLSYRKISNSFLKQFRDDEYRQEDDEIEKSKSCEICQNRLYPARINKDFKRWKHLLPPLEEMNDGCVFPSGLLQSIDFMTEKMVFYDSDYNEIYHKSKKEIDQERRDRRPDLYCKKSGMMCCTLENYL